MITNRQRKEYSIMPSFIRVTADSDSSLILRKEVQMGELFIVKGGDKLYAHMGVTTNPPTPGNAVPRYKSVNLRTGEDASSPNGDSKVQVVGTYTIEANLHEDFAHLA
jgi:hypothetical protein